MESLGAALEERHLRCFIDSNLIPIIRRTTSGKVLEANQAMADLSGFSIEDMLSDDFNTMDWTTEESKRLDATALDLIRNTGRCGPYEKELIKKDGSRFSVLYIVTAVNEDEIIAFLVDRTQQKRAQSELRESEAHFRLLAGAIPQIFWICAADGRTEFINQRFYEVTGLNADQDDNGFLWLQAIHSEDREELLRQGQLASSDKVWEHKARYIYRNGEARWHIIRAVPIFDEHTHRLRWFGTSTDIHSQALLHERIRASEANFHTLADAIPQIVWTANCEGEIDFFNHRWFEYTGLNLEQSLHDGWQLLIHPEDLKKYLSEWSRALASGDTYEMRFRLRRAVGLEQSATDPYRWHLGRAVALRNKEGRIWKWFATWTEVGNL
jgi:PAS domain S-box-containing protein